MSRDIAWGKIHVLFKNNYLYAFADATHPAPRGWDGVFITRHHLHLYCENFQ